MRVRDLMTTSVASVPNNQPLSAAARLMWDCDCGAIPVVEDSSDRVVGIITDRDICMSTWSRDSAPSAILISDAMSKNLFHCAPDDSISSAENLMRTKQIRRVPVLDSNRRLMGILSLADIVTQGQRAGVRPASSELAPTEIAATLANICQPRPVTSVSARI